MRTRVRSCFSSTAKQAYLKPGWRGYGGLWLGKVSSLAARLAGTGGSTLPGRLVSLAAPSLLPYLAAQPGLGNLVITGTNGKTTCASLLAGMAGRSGLKLVHNFSGANLVWGVTSIYISAASWRGSLNRDLAVIEADEAAFPGIVSALDPRGVIITNLFSDQLDRLGGIEKTREFIQKGLRLLPAGSVVLLNADDPAVASLEAAPGQSTLYYGLDLDPLPGKVEPVKACPHCQQRLGYSKTYFSHLGHYYCPGCGFSRPQPEYKIAGTGRGNNLIISAPGQKHELRFSLPGTYNLYNALAAWAGSRVLGLPADTALAGLHAAVPIFGRMEKLEVCGRKVIMALIKNSAGADQVLQSILKLPGPLSLLLAINDREADGSDVSWLWEVNFEQLAASRDKFIRVVVSGTRAADAALRLKYAGLPVSGLLIESRLPEGLLAGLGDPSSGETLVILPSYTAMLELRNTLCWIGKGGDLRKGALFNGKH